MQSSQNLFNTYDLSNYMFNNNTSIPFHFNWFVQDNSDYKRGGTAPTNATRNSLKNVQKYSKPNFDNTMYNDKWDTRHSIKDPSTNMIKLNDIQKISKIYNSTNIKPEKFTRRKPIQTYTSSKNLLKTAKNIKNERNASSSQSMRNLVEAKKQPNSFGNLWISEAIVKKKESYFLERNKILHKQKSQNETKPIFEPKKPIMAYRSETNIPQKLSSVEGIMRFEKPEIDQKGLDNNEKNTGSEGSSFDAGNREKEGEVIKTMENVVFNETIHTDASSEPDKEDEDVQFSGKPPKMFLTAQHFRQEVAENQENDDNNYNFPDENSNESSYIKESKEGFRNEENEENIEKSLINSKMMGLSRPKTSEGGRRRRVIPHKNNVDTCKETLENDEKPMKLKEIPQDDEEELILETKAINLDYIQSLQNQRPPCRKKVQAFNLEMNFDKTTIMNTVDRPPSRHKTPPKAIGLDIPNPDKKTFPIKNMYLKCGEEREDSFNGLDCIKLENKVNLSNFLEKKQWKTSVCSNGQGKNNGKEEQKSEILEEMGKKENQSWNSHPFSASTFNHPSSNKTIKKLNILSKNNNILNDKALLKDNYMNSNKIINPTPLEIIINHNKSPSQKLANNNSNVQLPFETSLGNDFLSLFANCNADGITPRGKKAL